MYIDSNSLEILKMLYEKYKQINKLKNKISGGWTFNMERTKNELSDVEAEAQILESPLYAVVDNMRLKVMRKFLSKHSADECNRRIAYCRYGRLLYDFKSHVGSFTSFNKFISSVDKIFDPNLFLQCLEEQKEDKYKKNPIKDLFYIVDYSACPAYERWFTFILDENKEKFNKMLTMFPEEKQEVRTYYRPDPEEHLEIWERDEYDDSYGAWLRKGGHLKEQEDYDGAFDPFDGGDFF